MKILFVITKSNWGGAQRYVYDVALGMRDRGHKVIVAAGGDGEMMVRLQEAGVETISIRQLGRDVRLLQDWQVLRALDRIIREVRPDVLHVNSSKVGGLGALAGRLRGTRVVFTAHGWPFKEPRPFPVRSIIWLASWMTGVLAHRVIVPSQDDYDHGSRLPGVTKRLCLIYHGREVDYQDRVAARRELAKHLGQTFSDDDVLIGCVAELHSNKGHEHLLRAMTKISATLVLIGAGELEQRLKEQTAQLDLGDRVLFAGHVSAAATLMEAFDVVVLSSVKEGLPYVLIEAALAGCPIVASRIGGIPEIVADKTNICPVSDSDCLAARMKFLIEDEQARHRTGEQQRAFAEDRFSMSAMMQKHHGVYIELL